MDSTVGLWILKGSPKESAVEHLMGYKKARLFQLAEAHQVAVKKNDTKVKMIDALIPVIKQHFAIDMKELSPSEKGYLAQIKANRTDVVELSQVQELVEKGYLFVYLDNGEINAVFPNEWQEGSDELGTESAAQPSLGKFAPFFHNAATFKQIFGYINIDHLVTVWNRYYDDSLNSEKATQLLQEHNLSR